MGNPDKKPLDETLDSRTETGKGSSLRGGPRPSEPGHDGAAGDGTDFGETYYSPEMGSIVVERRPDRDEP